MPYARLTWDKQHKDAPRDAFARSQTIEGSLPYAVAGVPFDGSYLTLQFGARTQLFGFDANLGASVTTEQGIGNDASVFATVGKSF